MKRHLCCCLVLALLTGLIGVPVRAETVETTEAAQTAETTEFVDATESTPESAAESTTETTAEPTTESTEPSSAETRTPEQTEPVARAGRAEVLSERLTTKTDIGNLAKLNPGVTGITILGMAVWVRQQRVVLLDKTDSVDLILPDGFSAKLGDVLRITGDISEVTEDAGESRKSFQARQVEKTDMEELEEPEKSDLPQSAEALRVSVEAEIAEKGKLKWEGRELRLETDQEISGPVQAVGIILNGVFYADTVTSLPPKPDSGFWQRHWAGQLHKHSSVSGGFGSAGEIFALSALEPNMDFFAVTDHSDSFDNGENGAIDKSGDSTNWKDGKQAEKDKSNAEFVAILGYEMAWGEAHGIGHINTFNTPGWQTTKQVQSLEDYVAELKKLSEPVSQFNHPSIAYGNFDSFRNYDADSDRAIQLLEVFGERGSKYLTAYQEALDAGWHLAPTAGSNSYDRDFGTARTVVLADSLTKENLLEAMRNRRVYATQDSDFRMEFKINGHDMGSIIGNTEELTLTAKFRDPTDEAIGRVEVISKNEKVVDKADIAENQGEHTFHLSGDDLYYYLRVTQPDGDVAVSAPVWVDSFQDLGIRELRAQESTLSAGSPVTLELTFFNQELAPMENKRAVLKHGDSEIGQFVSAEGENYRCTFTWQEPGEVCLNVQAQAEIEDESRTFQKEIVLHYWGEPQVSGTIAQIRAGTIGTVYRTKGYASSGNTNPATTFKDRICLQDATGGIPVKGTFSDKIQLGMPREIVGVLREEKGERYLDLIDCEKLPGIAVPPLPAVVSCGEAAAKKWDGMLVQLQGTLLSVEKEGSEVSKLTIRDGNGDEAVIVIEPEIRSGSGRTGKLGSKIVKDKTIRVIGICAREPDGSRVVRVRNCDEVVYVPPVPDPTNPKTGDPWQNLLSYLEKRVK